MSDEKESSPIGAALAVLEQDRQERAKAFQAEMQVLMERYRCTLVPNVLIEGGQVRQCGIQIVTA